MSILHAKIADIDDENLQQMIDEVYHCVGWARDDGNFSTLWYLLGGIGAQDPKALSEAHLPTAGLLTTKVGSLPDGVIYDLCLEIAQLKKTHLDDGKKVIAMLKLVLPKPVRARKPSRGQIRHEAQTRLILQRRRNGDL